jgi:hypothetical protein
MEAGSRKSQPGQLWQSILGIRSYKGLGNIFNGFNHKNSQNALQPVSNGSREKLVVYQRAGNGFWRTHS